MRRCPRISASSRTPPSDMRTKRRPSARAIDLPSEVLPTPGGPTKHRIGPLLLAGQLEHRQVLDDALLDLAQAEVVLVEDASRPRAMSSWSRGRPCCHGSDTSQSR